jgi:predicted nucleic acid-binding protein
MVYYLDSSAWVKRYFDEPGSGKVNHLFEQQSEMLGCSPLGLIEVGSVLARKRKAGEVEPGELKSKRASLLKDWRHFLWVEVTSKVVERAFDITETYGLRGADTLHLASALELKDDLDLNVNEFTLVTSDHELKAAALQSGLIILDPQEQTIH